MQARADGLPTNARQAPNRKPTAVGRPAACTRGAISSDVFHHSNPINKMKKTGHCAALAALFTCVSMSAFAQTTDLDCTKPHRPIERTVCNSAALRALDARESTYYEMLLE